MLRGVFASPGYRPPLLPAVALELVQLSAQPNVQFGQVVKVLERDPVLAAKVLSIAQSALYASRSPILSLHQAAVRLGLKTLRELVLEAALHLRVFRAPGYAGPMDLLARHSTATAHVVKAVCARTLVDAEYAFLCGLLHDVGLAASLLVLAEDGRFRGAAFQDLAPTLNELHEEASGLLARLWKLPEPIARAVATHHEVTVEGVPQPVNAAIIVAEQLVWEAGLGLLPPPEGAGPFATAMPEPPLEGLDANWTGLVEEARVALGMEPLSLCAARAEAFELLRRQGLESPPRPVGSRPSTGPAQCAAQGGVTSGALVPLLPMASRPRWAHILPRQGNAMPQEPPSRVYDVAIVGAGASGTLLAIQLMRQARSGLRVALLDRAGAFARGVAFGTMDAEHLLNLPADRMSALPEEPDHFASWLGRLAPASASLAFAPRRRSGRYLGATLEEARRAGRRLGGKVDLVEAEVTSLEGGPRTQLALSVGGRLSAPAVVLALGAPPPEDPKVADRELIASALYARTPWSREALSGLTVEAPVLLLGSGLTLLDAVLTLTSSGHRGPLWVLSRHGLLPLAEGPLHPLEFALTLSARGRLSALTRAIRQAAKDPRAGAPEEGWRSVVEAVRSSAQGLWQELPLEERRRFVRHLLPFWEAHAQRAPPSVARRIEALRAAGQLRVVAGRLVHLALDRGEALARWRTRGGGEALGRFARVVNCSGPGLSLGPRDSPLLASLFASRRARPGPLGMGLDTEGLGAVRDALGHPSEHLFAIGPLRRGELWESTSIPEIRTQAALLARHLLREL